MKIWANTIVNNEENFIWFSIMSVINYVDKILIYDTGSTDNTVKIIEEVRKRNPDKIIFKQVGEVSSINFPKVRQQMLEESKCDWILILDGDEIWWEDSIRKVTDKVKSDGDMIEGIAIPFIVPIGDIYHIQEERAGKYNLLGRKGHLSLRAFKKSIPGLHVDWPYGKESFLDLNNIPIQDRKKNMFLDAPYIHTTHLKRSSKKRNPDKKKLELGNKLPNGFKFPEVFFDTYPDFIPSPFSKISGTTFIKASLITPFRKIKRRLIR